MDLQCFRLCPCPVRKFQGIHRWLTIHDKGNIYIVLIRICHCNTLSVRTIVGSVPCRPWRYACPSVLRKRRDRHCSCHNNGNSCCNPSLFIKTFHFHPPLRIDPFKIFRRHRHVWFQRKTYELSFRRHRCCCSLSPFSPGSHCCTGTDPVFL